jgi:anti-anti-sigma regulatory factor
VAGHHLPGGIAKGEQVGVFGWSSTDDLRDALGGLVECDELLATGAARVGVLERHFSPSRPPEPAELITYWSDATRQALDAGYNGLRVVADTTPWAGLDAPERIRFLRGEQLVNRSRATQPFTLICACDRSMMSDEALEDTAGIHPSTQGVDSPLGVFVASPSGVRIRGEADAVDVAQLTRLLATIPLADASDALTIDASDLRFIDHSNLLALERFARDVGLPAVVLRNAPRVAGRIITLLGITHVRVEGGP